MVVVTAAATAVEELALVTSTGLAVEVDAAPDDRPSVLPVIVATPAFALDCDETWLDGTEDGVPISTGTVDAWFVAGHPGVGCVAIDDAVILTIDEVVNGFTVFVDSEFVEGWIVGVL